jgi:hypothetical protein
VKSSQNFCINLVLELEPGRSPWPYLLMLLAAMLLSVALADLNHVQELLLSLGLTAWFARTCLVQSRGLRRLVWRSRGDWRLMDARGHWKSARLLHAWSAGPALCTLLWTDDLGRRTWLLLTPSMAAEDSRRRLCRHLRWRAPDES